MSAPDSHDGDDEPVPWMQQLLDNPFLLLFLGVLVPWFNTAVQPELEALRPVGVSNQTARFALDAKVVEALHIASVFERADEFDVISNQFDFLQQEISVGSYTTRTFNFITGDPRNPWLASVFVPAEHRGKGIASALVRAVEDAARRHPHDRLMRRRHPLVLGHLSGQLGQ